MTRISSAVLALVLTTGTAFGFDSTFKKYAEVLSAHVRDGVVDYRGIKERSLPVLEAALADIGSVDAATFEKWPKPDQVAYLLNAYNGYTLQMIVDFYPVKSIREIGGKVGGGFFGKESKQWKVSEYEAGGKKRTLKAIGKAISLDDIEHEWLRAKYQDPRVHFALICGAKSCPFLRNEPFVAAKLSEQLEAQGKQFLADTFRNRYDAATDTLHVSKIFDWFSGDFTRKGSLVSFIKPYFPKDWTRATEASKIKYLEYDWSLNDTPGKG